VLGIEGGLSVTPYTPGKWIADEYMRVLAMNGAIICDTDPFDALPEESAANLALIAAAPDLLEALTLIAADLNLFLRENDAEQLAEHMSEGLIATRAAIAKATDEKGAA
jgi:hypothetical protein